MSGNVSSESDDDLARKVSSAQHPPSTTSSRENLQPVKTANSGFHRRSLPRAIIRRKSSQLESFAPYDPELADRSVHFSNLIFDARFWQMLKTAASYIFATILDKLSPPKGKEATEARRRERAMRLKATCIELGETFIKLAQFLSVRRDFLPTEIADELAQLQDQVPPFDFTVVAATIQKDLGAPPEEIFASFDPLPLASASVGQVHLARLKNGTEVVVKVQRPDLRQRFYQDLGYMRLVVNWGRTLLGKNFDWDGWIELSDEFGRNLFCEVNYIQEGRNADKLRRVLRDFEDVRIPRVFWKYTGRRVLTLEYAPGTKIDKLNELHARSINLPKLARLLVNCYLEQVLMHGFFHADPHAGNLSIDDEGRLVIYDFGMMGEITEEQRAAITGCISAVIRRSTAELVENLRQLGILKHSANAQPVERALQPFIDYYAGKEIRDLDFT
ncbi:MAG TPA: AarF/UbiB family protein, partial [Candidatus Obscuribacterales bacterium]